MIALTKSESVVTDNQSVKTNNQSVNTDDKVFVKYWLGLTDI